ncbi:MAG TPA: 50S ribosomal protein L6 [Anaerolineales bacterium]|nr:50S ribosomal protein L6 [Anaerolineales bacterium]
MSRVGRKPISVPSGVQVEVTPGKVTVKGPKGQLERTLPEEVSVKLVDATLTVERPSDEPRIRALHGLTRALLNNMVIGASQGFEKALQVEGVGYRPELDGRDLVLFVGYSHPVRVKPREGISFDVDTRSRMIKVMGPDKELVGQVAAEIRKVRPPEPYKGKGIRYFGEYVRRKAGKAGKVG